MSYLAHKTRTGVFPFDQCHASNNWVSQPFQYRRLGRIAHTPRRYRIHLRNYNLQADSWGGALTNVQIGIGTPLYDSTGLPTGVTSAAPISLQASTSVAASTELITAWRTNAGEIEAYKPFMLTYGFTTPATGTTHFGPGPAWQTFTVTDAFVAAPASQVRNFNLAPLSLWIEYEFNDDDAPVILVLGNSLSNGSNSVTDNPGEQGAWHTQWALRQKGSVASLTAAGIFAAQFTPAQMGTRWQLYNSCAVMPEYDAVIYAMLTSSDTIDYATASVQADFTSTVNQGKTLYPNARHIATNIPPRVGFTGVRATNTTTEYKRHVMNTWHHMLGGGVEQCWDIDSLLTDWADPARIRYPFDADGTHFVGRGHARISDVAASGVTRRRPVIGF